MRGAWFREEASELGGGKGFLWAVGFPARPQKGVRGLFGSKEQSPMRRILQPVPGNRQGPRQPIHCPRPFGPAAPSPPAHPIKSEQNRLRAVSFPHNLLCALPPPSPLGLACLQDLKASELMLSGHWDRANGQRVERRKGFGGGREKSYPE